MYMYTDSRLEVGHESDITWMIFNVFIWAQLELELGIMCASLPALRVFFRKFLSGSLSRLTRSNNSNLGSNVGSRKARSRISDKMDPESTAITEHELQNRDSFRGKAQPSVDQTTLADNDRASWSPSTAPSEVGLIKGPREYEAYSNKNMEKYRQSFRQYVTERQDKHRNYSQPFDRPSSGRQS